MAKSLVIVESPAKAKTIGRILGKNFTILASYGHVRDLPNKQGSVDIENEFEPTYEILADSEKHIKKLKDKLASCDTLYLATDLDREGEAIAWHLLHALGLNDRGRNDRGSNDAPDKGGATPKAHSKKQAKNTAKKKPHQVDIKRIVFHEITREAILEAIEHPRDIAYDLVDAQKARRVLDYLVGFNLSPFLWKKIRYGLSAGRVQSVALRLICEREREIQAFKSQEYWTISADLTSLKGGEESTTFGARLIEADGKKLGKFDIPNEARANELVTQLEGADCSVITVKPKTSRRNPSPPFITSTLQQEASRKLGFSARKTMSVAQKLYEGMEINGESAGLITYMRTDSVNLADVALRECQEVVERLYGKEYGLKQPRKFKRKVKNAQEAHEAIRPTSLGRLPDDLRGAISADELKLYDLIWKRTVACQMAQAIIDSISVDIGVERNGSGSPAAMLRATGSTVRFQGFMRVYTEGQDDHVEEKSQQLPPLEAGQSLALLQLKPDQHFTEPPPRYGEATLVKSLEEHGIGRPSTYASIMNTLQQRSYVRLEKKRFYPEDIGLVVSDLLVKHFSKYVDYQFTARLEDELDLIAEGKASWRGAVRNFWDPFIELLKEKDAAVKKSDVTEEATDETCPDCEKPLVVKLGRFGKFMSCSGFPECKYSRPLEKVGEELPEEAAEDAECENCGKPMKLRRGRYGPFLACTGYPECKTTRKLNAEASAAAQKVEETDEECDKCGAKMVIKSGRYGRFLSCSRYPKCKAVRAISIGIDCPEDGCSGYLTEKRTKRGKPFYSCCRYPECKFSIWEKPVAEKCPECEHPYLVEKWSKAAGKKTVCPSKECSYSVAAAGVAAAEET